MTFTTIAIAVALIVFVLARRMRGEAVPAPKKLFVLPVIVGAIGLENISHAKPNAVDIGVIVAGMRAVAGPRPLRGRFDRLSVVNGAPYMAWSAGSVVDPRRQRALEAGARCRRRRRRGHQGRLDQFHPA